MENLKSLNLYDAIREFVLSGKQLLGVCLGLQLLFTKSEEFGNHSGLDLIPGTVVRFPGKTSSGKIIKVPQIGWNTIYPPQHNPNAWLTTPLTHTKKNEFMYFVHSYYVLPEEKNNILSLTSYEETEYCSSIKKNNIIAFQFHPEKSGPEGIQIYQQWAKLI